MEPDRSAFLRSLGDELGAQTNRVRQLIGDKHWGWDGRHKESILAALLRRHLPSGVLVASGFVLDSRAPDRCSREQDLLVIDTLSEQPIFVSDGLAVTFDRNVLAAISVKSAFGKEEVEDAVATLTTAIPGTTSYRSRVLLGGFHFSESKKPENPETSYRHVCTGLGNADLDGCAEPILLCSMDNTAIVIDSAQPSLSEDERRFRVRGFECGGVAASLFLFHVLEHVARIRSGQQHGLGSVLSSEPFQPHDPPAEWL